MNRIKKLYTKYQELIEYIIFGVLTTLVNILVFYLFNTVFQVSYLISNAISIIVAILFAFITNKLFVFRSKTPNIKAAFKEFYLFVGLRLVSGLLDMLTMYILVDAIHLDANVSKLLTQFIVVVLNYVFSKLFIFKSVGG